MELWRDMWMVGLGTTLTVVGSAIAGLGIVLIRETRSINSLGFPYLDIEEVDTLV